MKLNELRRRAGLPLTEAFDDEPPPTPEEIEQDRWLEQGSALRAQMKQKFVAAGYEPYRVVVDVNATEIEVEVVVDEPDMTVGMLAAMAAKGLITPDTRFSTSGGLTTLTTVFQRQKDVTPDIGRTQ